MSLSRNFRIERDTWGVPHIWGQTDADAAYGLSWARAEDNFPGMQEAFMIIRGRYAEIAGIKGIGSDILVFLIQADEVLNGAWETMLSATFKKVLSAAIDGINYYATEHSDAINYPDLFPITEVDILKGYILSQTFTSGAIYALGKVVGNKMDRLPEGSNSFAINSKRMADGKTLLVSNVHQPMGGPWSFYEAHICSDEGWNMLGALYFPFITPLFGCNPDLAWTPTNNYANFSDTYVLDLHPSDKMKYRLDDRWDDLVPLTFRTRIKIGILYLPFRKNFYLSKYGITIKNKKGCFAVRFPARFCIKAAEQLYWMGKSRNLQEFKKALHIQGLASQNLMYADKNDNIFFISNGLFPYRNPKYKSWNLLPGNTSEVLWEPEFHPLSSLPQIENPLSGLLYNLNNPPFFATEESENIDPDNFNPTFGFLRLESNRGLRFKEIMKSIHERKISYDEVKSWKYDNQFADAGFYSFIAENIDELLDTCYHKYRDLQRPIHIIRQWNRRSDPDNEQASIMAIFLSYLVNYIDNHFLRGQSNRIPEEVFVKCLRKSKKHLLRYFGKLEVPLRHVQLLVRGQQEIPIGGMPENIAAIFIKKHKKGKFMVIGGDSYIQFVRFSNHEVEIESVVPYGSSECPDSPHYADQMSYFASGQLKKMSLNFFREKESGHAYSRSESGRQ